MASTTKIPVRWDTYVRAQTDTMFKSVVDMGGFGKFHHLRQPTPLDKQAVIRMNRDTLYSAGVFDLISPVTITIPDTGDRYQSMHVVSEDQHTPTVFYDPGEYTLTQDKVGTRYVQVSFRTLVDAAKPEDIKAVNEIQDKIKVQQASPGTFEIPNWDQKGLAKLTDAVNVLASTMQGVGQCFGSKKEVDPIAHLLGTAYGWGGLPVKDATYFNVVADKNDGKTPHTLTVKDVPVDGFWSVSLYNGKGFFEENKYNAYSINNLTGVKNKDGSITIHFGGDPKQPNFLYIMDGWNYIIRLYRAHKEILDGKWTFPAAQPVK